MLTKRKWGWYLTLFRCPWLCIKILKFNPNGKLSTQKHEKRNEWWLFLNGISDVWNWPEFHSMHSLGIRCEAGDTCYVPRNNVHKIINNTKKSIYVLEVQYGERCEEEDIKRYN